MTGILNIEFKGLDEVRQKLATAPEKLGQDLNKLLEKAAREIELKAKQNASKDIGGLANSINVKSEYLNKEIGANVFYASFVEFGTGRFAADYVATLPEDWQTYARQFKGQSGGGTFQDFLAKMIAWVKRKGIAGTYSVKTQRRTGNKANQETQDKEVAYLIVRSILKNGIHPHPFLYPAFNEVKPKLESDIAELVKTFSL